MLRSLAHNISAGARLAIGMRVSALCFRISVEQLIALTFLSLLLLFLSDVAFVGFEGRFSWYGIQYQGFYIALMLLASFVLSFAYRRRHLLLALPVILTAGELLPMLFYITYAWLHSASGAQQAVWLHTYWWMLTLWYFFICWRSIAVALGVSIKRHALLVSGGAAVLILGLWLPAYLRWLPYSSLWISVPPRAEQATNLPRITSEEVFSVQSQLLEDALNGLEEQRPGEIDLYFVGFAAYGSQDVFMKDILFAQKLFDERFDTRGRSVALVNNRKTLLKNPIATATNLGSALNVIGSVVDADEDILFLYISSHGSQKHSLSVELEPLELQHITPTGLHRILQEADIRWKIIAVSACYSGGYIEPLKDDYTMIITAAQKDRQSFGCSHDSDATYFGKAYFEQALAITDSFVEAFAAAKTLIAEREQKERQSPSSNPQVFVGKAIAGKLREFERQLPARRQTTAPQLANAEPK